MIEPRLPCIIRLEIATRLRGKGDMMPLPLRPSNQK
jgi:hypothetical protein